MTRASHRVDSKAGHDKRSDPAPETARLFNRDLLLLLVCQTIFVAGSVMTVTLGGIIGAQLAPSRALSTLPVSLTVVGTALGTLPATRLMQHIGRRDGFTCAALTASVACAVALAAVIYQSFWLYCLSTLLLGSTLAFSQQFRFAATETVDLSRAGTAISIILLGSVGGALIGPELVASSDWLWPEFRFAGALASSAGLFVFAALLLRLLKLSKVMRFSDSDQTTARPVSELAAEPLFLLAIGAGVVGQGIMTFVMTATPVSMHIMDGHSMADTASVIRAHVLAMYVPSLISGVLISRLGERRLMLAGVAIYLLTLSTGLMGQGLEHYLGALIFLGIGWNFLFVGGTTLLVKTYMPAERFRAQGLNDAAVFGTSALASLMAGAVLSQIGWQAVLWSTLLPIVLLGIAIGYLFKRPLPHTVNDANQHGK